jgi:hypothetical protein
VVIVCGGCAWDSVCGGSGVCAGGEQWYNMPVTPTEANSRNRNHKVDVPSGRVAE